MNMFLSIHNNIKSDTLVLLDIQKMKSFITLLLENTHLYV